MRVWPRARAWPQPALRPGPCALAPPCAPAATPAARLGARGITSGSLDLSYFFVRGHTSLDSLWEIPRTIRPQSSSTAGLSLWVSRAPLDRNPCAAGTFQKTPGHTRRRALMAQGGSGDTPMMPAAQMQLPGPAPACPPTPGAYNAMGTWQEHGPRRPATVQCGTAHTEPTLHLHYPSMQYAYICIPTTLSSMNRGRTN